MMSDINEFTERNLNKYEVKEQNSVLCDIDALFNYLNEVNFNYWIDFKKYRYKVVYKNEIWDVCDYTCSSYHPHITLISENAIAEPMTLLSALNFADTFDIENDDIEVEGSIPYLYDLIRYYGINHLLKLFNNKSCYYWTQTADHNRKELEPIIDKINPKTLMYYVIGKYKNDDIDFYIKNMNSTFCVAPMLYITQKK